MQEAEVKNMIDEKLIKCKEGCANDEKELRGGLDTKLERSTFFAVMGIVLTLIGSILGVLFGKMSSIESTYIETSNRLTRMEVTLENTNKNVEQLQKIFAKFDVSLEK